MRFRSDAMPFDGRRVHPQIERDAITMKFHFGLGKYFSPIERENRIVIRKAVEAGFGVHYCLDYTGAARFFKSNTSRTERARIEVIARVPCFDARITESEVDLTLRKLDVDKIDVLQLWGGDEIYDLYSQDSALSATVERLRRSGKIVSCVPQLYDDQTRFVSANALPVEAFAFYGSPIGLHVSEALLETGALKDSVCMSCFGGVDRQHPPEFRSASGERTWRELTAAMSWNSFCLAYVESLGFVSRAVGTTGKAKHMDEIVNHFASPARFDETQARDVRRIAFDSCRHDHTGPTGTRERWLRDHRVFRSPITEMKALAHSVVKGRPALKRAVDFARGRA